MRLASPDRLAPQFLEDMLASHPAVDFAYFHRLAAEATTTIGWLERHGVAFASPPYYLAAGPPRIQPVGGGGAILGRLTSAALKAGVGFRYTCTAERLVAGGDGAIRGLEIRTGDGLETIAADAVILACGGFAGDAAAREKHLGAGGASMRMISPGTAFNTGDGIRMGVAAGAKTSGDWNGMHAEPVDPRSSGPAPVVLVYPYGIVVDRNGRRFFDEGAGLVHETWETFARAIHFSTPGRIAFAILDASLVEITNYQRAIRSEVPPVEAPTIAGLAGLIGVDPRQLEATVAAYNAATGDAGGFDATRTDGLATAPGFNPRKSNWARALAKPPFLAYPLVGAIAYAFGGLATNAAAEVLGDDGPVAGLYAAGEITGHFHGIGPNAVSVLRALVFGRIAGRSAAARPAAAMRPS
jgi:tricarballylate dehydrogenase